MEESTRIPKNEDTPAYAGPIYASPAPAPQNHKAWYDPRGWSLRKKLLVVGIAIVIIVAVVAGSVEGVKANRYPDYRPLNYSLADVYEGPAFFNKFNYYSGADPTDGFVEYVDRAAAAKLNLTYYSTSDDSVVLRVDNTDPDANTGRKSVRLESKTSYDSGLFLFDIVHTPFGCGTWPALWLTDPSNWPENGEIDVLETTNRATEGNAVTLHTGGGGHCSMDVKRKQRGKAQFETCSNATHGNAGCGVEGDPSTYGPEMNAGGGGVRSLSLPP